MDYGQHPMDWACSANTLHVELEQPLPQGSGLFDPYLTSWTYHWSDQSVPIFQQV